jgi:hypothetical protein
MRSLCVAVVLISTATATCPPDYRFAYVDRVHGFSICLPAGVTKEAATGYPAGSVLFSGFGLQPKTNLRSKQLLIIPGEYHLLKSAAPFGHFAANGSTFERARLEEGSAGHLMTHLIYTWKNTNTAVHFDFQDRSVNIYNFDLSQRPIEYNRKDEIKLSEQIMSTFRNHSRLAKAASG